MHNYSTRIEWSEEDRAYVATSPEFPDLSGIGETAADALSELGVALDLAIEAHRERGWTVPEPKVLAQHSGQLRLRLPRGLHKRLVDEAESEGVSLNTLLVCMLSAGIAERSTWARMREEIWRHALRFGITDHPLAGAGIPAPFAEAEPYRMGSRIHPVPSRWQVGEAKLGWPSGGRVVPPPVSATDLAMRPVSVGSSLPKEVGVLS